MILGNPWGLLGLLAVPAILAIHLYRRRYQPLTVTGLFLYGAPTLAPTSGRQRERLRRRLSLICELLAALAATAFLCDLHRDDLDHGRHLAFILDDRRSLQAVADGHSVRDRAAAVVAARMAGLGADDRVTLIRSGTPPRVLAGPAATPAEALAILGEWTAAAPWHSLDASLALGLALAGDGGVVVVSDREPADLPAEVGLIACGVPRANAGFSDLRWLRDAKGERLALRVLAQGGEARRRLTVHDGERLVHTGGLTLADGVAQAVTVPLADTVGETLVVALDGDDPLASDDRVTLHRPESRRVSWQISDVDEVTDAALRRALAVVPLAVEARPAHLLIGDATATSGAWTVGVASGGAEAVFGPFLARRGDPLLADLDATGVLWSGGAATVDDEALLLAGDAVLVSGHDDGRDRRLRIWCDLARSTLVDHPAWPVLIANLVAARSADLPGLVDPNVACGQAFRVVLPAEGRSLVVVDPAGERQQFWADRDGAVIHPGLASAGSHDLRSVDAAGTETAWRSVHAHACDARLADLAAAATLARDPVIADDAEVERRRGPLGLVLPALLAAAAAALAWRAHRREEGA